MFGSFIYFTLTFVYIVFCSFICGNVCVHSVDVVSPVCLPEISADFNIQLNDVTVKEGNTAEFECTLTLPVDKSKVHWFINNKEIEENEKFQFIVDGTILKLVIKDSAPVDAGTVTIKIGDKDSTAKFTVEEIAVEFTVPLKDQTVFEKSTVEFTCELNKEVDKVQWLLDDEELQPGDGIEIIKDGPLQHRLIIRDVIVEDSGQIMAKAADVSSVATLEVQELPVDFTVPLNDVSVMETETAEFVCELSKDVDTVKWLLDEVELKESKRVQFIKEGCKHKLLIHDCSVDDEGLITVQVEGKKTSASLFIRGGSGLGDFVNNYLTCWDLAFAVCVSKLGLYIYII